MSLHTKPISMLRTLAAIGVLCGAIGAQAADKLTVYSVRATKGLEPVMQEFTERTGIAVELVGGTHEELTARLKAEGASTPADLFITKDVVYLTQAAREGLYVPFQSKAVEEAIPAFMRDSSNLWTALTVRARVIMYHPEKVSPSELSTYEALGDSKWQGRLCLRTSKNSYNQGLIGWFLAKLGGRETLELLQKWAVNAGANILTGDTKVLEAIAAGQCDVGVANTYYLAGILKDRPDFKVKPFFPNQESTGVHTNGYGVGLVKQSANATVLLEYLVAERAQQEIAKAASEYPAAKGVTPLSAPLVEWGTFKTDETSWTTSGDAAVQADTISTGAGYN